MENEKVDKMVRETVDAVFKPKSLVNKLYQIYSHACYTNIDYSFTKNDESYYKDIRQALTKYEKQKQILEVLKNKQVNFLELKEDIINCDSEKRALEIYNERHPYDEECNDTQLTEDEFKLIKEWLNYERK